MMFQAQSDRYASGKQLGYANLKFKIHSSQSIVVEFGLVSRRR